MSVQCSKYRAPWAPMAPKKKKWRLEFGDLVAKLLATRHGAVSDVIRRQSAPLPGTALLMHGPDPRARTRTDRDRAGPRLYIMVHE